MNSVHLMALLLSSATLVACGGGDGAAKAEGSQPSGPGGAGSPVKKTVAPTSPVPASLDAALEAAKKEEALLEERAKAVAELEAKIKKDSEALALEKEAASKLEEGEAKVAALQAVKEKEAALEELKKSLEAASPKKKDGAAEGSDSEEEDAASPSPKKKAEETPAKPVVATLSKEVLEGVAGKLEAAKALKDEDGEQVKFSIVRSGMNGGVKPSTKASDFELRFGQVEIDAGKWSSLSREEAVTKVRQQLFENAALRTVYSNKGYRVALEDLKKGFDGTEDKENLPVFQFAFKPEEEGKAGVNFSLRFTKKEYEDLLKVVDAVVLEVLGLSEKDGFVADAAALAKAVETLDAEPLDSPEETPKKTPAKASATPADATGSKGASTTRKVREGASPKSDKKFGEIVAFGETFQVNAPVYASLKGELSAKESNVLGTMFYGTNNALFGIAQAYVNGAEGFALGGKQLETSAVSAFMAGNAFVEFQSGVVEANKVNGADFSGSRQQVVVGYDFTSGLTPFLQFGARQLSEGKVAHSEKSGYAGLTFESEKKNSFFGYASSITAKTGAVVSNVHGTSADSALFVEQGFTTTEGLKLDAVMSVSSKESTSFKVSVGFSR